MPRIALISDIHSNMAALNAVLADIGTQNVDAIYCLGDVVGYGPEPVAAMVRVLEVCAPGKCIAGNHDHAVVHEPIGFNRSARMAALWTNRIVRAGFFSFFGGKKRRWDWLKSLPTSFEEGDFLYVHASPRNPLEEYILEEHTRGLSFTGEDPVQLLNENFALIKRTCFVGHTHRPGVIADDDLTRWYHIHDLDYRWEIDDRKTIINIGSVGQPRDGDPRSCYVIHDGSTVWWRRVPYDIQATKKMIYDNPELENSLGDRLEVGR